MRSKDYRLSLKGFKAFPSLELRRCYTECPWWETVNGYKRRLAAVAAIFIISITIGVLVTQEGARIPLRSDQVASIGGVYEFAWSPDGKAIAYIGPTGAGFDIWKVPSNGGQNQRLTSTQRFKKQLRWSADGKWLAFIAYQDDGTSDLRVVDVAENTIVNLTENAAEESDPAWSPDSRQIAFTERTGMKTSVMSVDIQSGMVRKLTDAPAADLQWSPDGKSLAFVANFLQARDEHRENEDIFVVPAEGGEPRLVTGGTPRFRDLSPSWAPDSKRLVYAAEESGFSNLNIVDTQSGAKRVLTSATVDLVSPKWSPDGNMVAYVRAENSSLHVFAVSIGDGRMVRLSDAEGSNGGLAGSAGAITLSPPGTLAWSPDGKRLAYTHSDPARTSDIWVAGLEGARPLQLTNSMPGDLRRESRFAWPDRISYRSFDGQEISALVYKPKGPKPRAGHPAVLFFRESVDGAHTIAWDPIIQFLAGNGYLVFAPNVRGSGGHGREYRQLVAGHGGDYDVRDALFGLDRLSSEGLIDVDKVGVMGAGTGGFLTTAALIRGETRFKAAVAINAIVDAVTAASYPATEEWSRYMIGATPLENPAPYYERSIVNFVDALRTPIIFLYARQNPSAPFQHLQQFAVQAEVKGRWYDYRVFENEFGGWRTWRTSTLRNTLDGIEAMFEKYIDGRDRDVHLSRNR
jgi:dipeptidyl aminopeptidase/acylaminoacyl peptidase